MERRLEMDNRIRLDKLLNSPEVIKDDIIKAKLIKIVDKINHSDISSWEYNLEGTLFIHITDEVINRIGIIAYYDNLKEIIEGIYFKTSFYRFKTIQLIIDFDDLEYYNLYTEVILYSLKEIIDCLYSQFKLFTLKIELVCPVLFETLTQECIDIVDYLVIPITKQSSFDYSELDASYPYKVKLEPTYIDYQTNEDLYRDESIFSSSHSYILQDLEIRPMVKSILEVS